MGFHNSDYRTIDICSGVYRNLGLDRDEVNASSQYHNLQFSCVNVELSILVVVLIISWYHLDIT